MESDDDIREYADAPQDERATDEPTVEEVMSCMEAQDEYIRQLTAEVLRLKKTLKKRNKKRSKGSSDASSDSSSSSSSDSSSTDSEAERKKKDKKKAAKTGREPSRWAKYATSVGVMAIPVAVRLLLSNAVALIPSGQQLGQQRQAQQQQAQQQGESERPGTIPLSQLLGQQRR